MRLRQKALNGDHRAMDMLLGLARLLNSSPIGLSSDLSSEEDQAILDAYRQEIAEELGKQAPEARGLHKMTR